MRERSGGRLGAKLVVIAAGVSLFLPVVPAGAIPCWDSGCPASHHPGDVGQFGPALTIILSSTSATTYSAKANTTGWFPSQFMDLSLETTVDGIPDMDYYRGNCTGQEMCTTTDDSSRDCGDPTTVNFIHANGESHELNSLNGSRKSNGDYASSFADTVCN